MFDTSVERESSTDPFFSWPLHAFKGNKRGGEEEREKIRESEGPNSLLKSRSEGSASPFIFPSEASASIFKRRCASSYRDNVR